MFTKMRVSVDAWTRARDKRWLARWPVVRQKGAMRYVILHGVLGWALPVIIGSGLLLWIETPSALAALPPSVAVASIFIIGLGGILFACINWANFERIYRERSADLSPNPSIERTG